MKYFLKGTPLPLLSLPQAEWPKASFIGRSLFLPLIIGLGFFFNPTLRGMQKASLALDASQNTPPLPPSNPLGDPFEDAAGNLASTHLSSRSSSTDAHSLSLAYYTPPSAPTSEERRQDGLDWVMVEQSPRRARSNSPSVEWHGPQNSPSSPHGPTPKLHLHARGRVDEQAQQWKIFLENAPALRTCVLEQVTETQASILLALLRQAEHLESLTLQDCPALRETDLLHVARCSQLVELHLLGCPSISETVFELFQREKAFRGIKQLTLSPCPQLKKDALRDFLKDRSLHTLEVMGSPHLKDDQGAFLKHLSSLQSLSLKGCTGFSEKFIQTLTIQLPQLMELGLADCTQLKTLVLTGAYLRKVGLEGCLQLRELNLLDSPEVQPTAIEGLPKLPFLSRFFLTADQFENLLTLQQPGFLSQIQSVVVDCPYSPALPFGGAPDSSPEALLPQLKSLQLIQARNLHTLPSFQHLKQLTELRVEGSATLSDAEILCIRELKNLQSLSLSNCPNLTTVSCFNQLASLQTLCLRELIGLRSLSLDMNLPDPSHLTHLDLSGCTALTALTSPEKTPFITYLNLENCISLSAASFLGLKQLSCLYGLNLKGCQHLEGGALLHLLMTYLGLKKIQQQVPNSPMRIQWSLPSLQDSSFQEAFLTYAPNVEFQTAEENSRGQARNTWEPWGP